MSLSCLSAQDTKKAHQWLGQKVGTSGLTMQELAQHLQQMPEVELQSIRLQKGTLFLIQSSQENQKIRTIRKKLDSCCRIVQSTRLHGPSRPFLELRSFALGQGGAYRMQSGFRNEASYKKAKEQAKSLSQLGKNDLKASIDRCFKDQREHAECYILASNEIKTHLLNAIIGEWNLGAFDPDTCMLLADNLCSEHKELIAPHIKKHLERLHLQKQYLELAGLEGDDRQIFFSRMVEERRQLPNWVVEEGVKLGLGSKKFIESVQGLARRNPEWGRQLFYGTEKKSYRISLASLVYEETDILQVEQNDLYLLNDWKDRALKRLKELFLSSDYTAFEEAYRHFEKCGYRAPLSTWGKEFSQDAFQALINLKGVQFAYSQWSEPKALESANLSDSDKLWVFHHCPRQEFAGRDGVFQVQLNEARTVESALQLYSLSLESEQEPIKQKVNQLLQLEPREVQEEIPFQLEAETWRALVLRGRVSFDYLNKRCEGDVIFQNSALFLLRSRMISAARSEDVAFYTQSFKEHFSALFGAESVEEAFPHIQIQRDRELDPFLERLNVSPFYQRLSENGRALLEDICFEAARGFVCQQSVLSDLNLGDQRRFLYISSMLFLRRGQQLPFKERIAAWRDLSLSWKVYSDKAGQSNFLDRIQIEIWGMKNAAIVATALLIISAATSGSYIYKRLDDENYDGRLLLAVTGISLLLQTFLFAGIMIHTKRRTP